MKENVCLTGIQGLDEVLNGGLPIHHFYLVQGDPGVGKTTLALSFLFEGVKRGEKTFYISLSENKTELAAIAKSHGWSLENITILELADIDKQIQAESQNTVFHPAELELNQMTGILTSQIGKVQPARVVFDSLSEIRNLAQNPLRYRRQMLALKHYFLTNKATVLLLDDRQSKTSDLEIETLAHGVINLEMWTPAYGAGRRRLRISKLRGLKYVEGFHDFIIEKGGMKVFPRLVAVNRMKKFKSEKVSSGIAEMDLLTGGGLDRGTSNLFIGPAGCGKSSLGTQYAYSAAQRGEKVLIYVFEETLENFLKRAEGINQDLRPFIEKGLIICQHIDPAELSPGQLAHEVRCAVESQGIQMLVIDSVNGYLNAMPDEKFLTILLHELLTFLNQHGILSILIMAQHGLIDSMKSPSDITYLADTVVLLRYFEFQGHIKKAISVIKKRTGFHESSLREYSIQQAGITVGKPLSDFTGVLTGVPSYHGKEDAII
jgi:circadian clock protein KaiC